jgi:hypothetical protein
MKKAMTKLMVLGVAGASLVAGTTASADPSRQVKCPTGVAASSGVCYRTETQQISLFNPQYMIVGQYKLRLSVPVPSTWAYLGDTGADGGDYTQLLYQGNTLFLGVADYGSSAREYLASRTGPTSGLTYVGHGVWFEYVGSNGSSYFYAKQMGPHRIFRINVSQPSLLSLAEHVAASTKTA